MPIKLLGLFPFYFLLISCDTPAEDKFIFFLHNRFLEEHHLEEAHPVYGRVEYAEIIQAFKASGFKVISEQRRGNVNARAYAASVVEQIDSLLEQGIPPNQISVVGTSKGGYIAQYVSTLAQNEALNFVFIGSFRISDLEAIPEINFCGNILNIYERSDTFGSSAIERKRRSTCTIQHFQEIELQTEMGHGFLFKALEEWIGPTIAWANGIYD
ncbi:MAG: alpha/beta hydrolase [Bacteroidota bacterium]